LIRPRGKRFSIFDVVIFDGTGYMKARWFNQHFLQKNLSPGQDVIFSGAVTGNDRGAPHWEMDNPEYEIVTEDDDSFIHTKRIVPIYRITRGISQKQFRKIMFHIVQDHAANADDPIPAGILTRHGLPSMDKSVREVHFPSSTACIEALNLGSSIHHRRLSFNELFMLELGLAIMRRKGKSRKGIRFQTEGRLVEALLQTLPFELTPAQKRVIGEVRTDMRSPHPMNRLLQGDVGCGKTIVALVAMLDAVEAGYQAALMAPTEILAEQHYITIRGFMEQLGQRLILLTGNSRSGRPEKIASGDADIVIGTHALVQEGVVFKKLGLAVIDEQHKFGVMQRALLRKKGADPDLLTMTATPIPRSLALTVFGDLDFSVINELPPNRTPVITEVLDPGRKEDVYRLMRKEIGMGRRAYVVYPVIEESGEGNVKAAVQGKAAFEKVFPEFRVALLHGRMTAEERERTMFSFRRKEIDILVCTTVIEVGVDVPDATVMLIVHAERFGLAQLHQLRGRVGRGSDRAYCLLVAYRPCSEEAGRRLDAMVRTGDGFRIAEEDLGIRGPGDFLGTRQSGMPRLRQADVLRDRDLLETARNEAFSLVERTPDLKEIPFLKENLDVFWKGKIKAFTTG
jgi:ATP-dependent DNA helicase RecG